VNRLGYADRIAGIILVALLAFFGLSFILSYQSLLIQPITTGASPPQWFMTYRLFDILFLSLLIFAAIIGVSALFRPEKLPEGEAAITEEEAEEEED